MSVPGALYTVSAEPRSSGASAPAPPRYLELIERIFGITHILATLKRDEMIREGRAEELDDLVNSTRALQESVLDNGAMTNVAAGERDDR